MVNDHKKAIDGQRHLFFERVLTNGSYWKLFFFLLCLSYTIFFIYIFLSVWIYTSINYNLSNVETVPSIRTYFRETTFLNFLKVLSTSLNFSRIFYHFLEKNSWNSRKFHLKNSRMYFLEIRPCPVQFQETRKFTHFGEISHKSLSIA